MLQSTIVLRLVFLLLLVGCAGTPVTTVEHRGVMREVMHDGKTQARAQLGEYAAANTFGVGALAGLQGEIYIDDGVVLIATGSPENVSLAGPDAAATLLTTARVPSWREVVLDHDADLAALEEVIAAAVRAADRMEVEPVPFVVVGSARGLALHVVRGACPHDEATPGSEPARLAVEPPATVRLVGFFAPGREGVMTHHGTALHVHVLAQVAPGRRAMGHLDEAVVLAGAKVLVPADR